MTQDLRWGLKRPRVQWLLHVEPLENESKVTMAYPLGLLLAPVLGHLWRLEEAHHEPALVVKHLRPTPRTAGLDSDPSRHQDQARSRILPHRHMLDLSANFL